MEQNGMLSVRSNYFGGLTVDSSEAFRFTQGLPGFPDERCFIPVEIPGQRPLLYLQSARREDLCLITLPVRAVESGYSLDLTPEDTEALGLAEGERAVIGENVLCLAVLRVDENRQPAANLLAPIVVNMKTRVAVQAIQVGSTYSHRHLIGGAVAPC